MTTHNSHSPQSPLSNDDIIAAARQLRQEQNDRMHIRPWKRQSRWGWYVAIPAACLVGFALGFYLRPSAETPAPALAKTIVVTDTVTVREVVHDTVYQTKPVSQPISPYHLAKRSTSSPKMEKQPESEGVGVSMLNDGIPYDLLASSR
ncbi:MAG: hypothetical protein J6Y38_05370 [Bacteroidaceae bacterium]|nr:hypothetical protein [Bacteroidaceae bacterium]